MDYQNLNVLSKKDIQPTDTLLQVEAMINKAGKNRKQRRKLEKALTKTRTIVNYAQNRVDRSMLKEYQNNLDYMMVRFFSVLGIVLKNDYGFTETEEVEEITGMFEKLNAYLEEHRESSTEDLAKICYETTGIELRATPSN